MKPLACSRVIRWMPLLLWVPSLSIAYLGGNAESILSDAAQLSMTLSVPVISVTQQTSYAIQEMVIRGISIREYVSLSGIIFAITWKGSAQPSLRVLLGPHKSQLDQVKQNLNQPHKKRDPITHHHRRRAFSHVSDQLVVESSGRFRHIEGRAYLPALIPPGVPLDELQ